MSLRWLIVCASLRKVMRHRDHVSQWSNFQRLLGLSRERPTNQEAKEKHRQPV
jgi:hypothetical protein